MSRARLFLSLLTLLLASLAQCCIWDTDTLASEAKGNMDFVNVIVGRFQRNPPLYYEMRLKRCADAIAKGATDPGLFDDAAVACDRLGRDNEAIQWIERKRTVLPPLESATGEAKDHWYRYEANVGTFWAHHWLKNGSNPKKLAELDTAIQHIENAIKINPDAHFGREVVQLEVLRWIHKIKNPVAKWAPHETRLLAESLLKTESASNTEADRISKGLIGLIHLGNAWESIDVFRALSSSLEMAENGSLSQIAYLRAIEISDSGKKAIDGKKPSEPREDYFGYGSWPEERIKTFNVSEFARLRRLADTWHEDRTTFMMSKLKRGLHPDTDSTFWNDWTEGEPLQIKSPPFWTQAKYQMAAVEGVVVFFLVILPGFFIIRVIVRSVRAKRQNRQV